MLFYNSVSNKSHISGWKGTLVESIVASSPWADGSAQSLGLGQSKDGTAHCPALLQDTSWAPCGLNPRVPSGAQMSAPSTDPGQPLPQLGCLGVTATSQSHRCPRSLRTMLGFCKTLHYNKAVAFLFSFQWAEQDCFFALMEMGLYCTVNFTGCHAGASRDVDCAYLHKSKNK